MAGEMPFFGFDLARELLAAIEVVINRACLERETSFFLENDSPETGVVLENSLGTLIDVPSFEAFRSKTVTFNPEGLRGESAFWVIPRSTIEPLKRALREGLKKVPARDTWSRDEIEWLIALAGRIGAKKGWTLAYQVLL